MNRISVDRQCKVAAALVEGVSINATCRMTDVAKHTALKLLRDLGCAAAAYQNDRVRNLRVRRVQWMRFGPSCTARTKTFLPNR